MSCALTLNKIAFILDLPSPDSERPLANFQVDSRLATHGSLFFALLGQKVNGHSFLEEAFSKGAVAAVVAKDCQFEPKQGVLFKVDHPLKALQKIAKVVVSELQPSIAAITGSVGKTTTKEWVQTFLKKEYRLLASEGNQNSQIGLPLTLLNRLQGEEELLVLEMGMSGPNEIAELVKIAPPEVALVTTVALVHAEKFNSLEEIAEAKAEIFSNPSMRLKIFERELLSYNAFKQLSKETYRTFSLSNPQADYGLSEGDSLWIEERFTNQKIDIRPFPFLGRHHLHNLLASVAVARYFEMSWDQIKKQIPLLKLPEKRSEWVETKKGLFLNDSYNASEVSVKAALNLLKSSKRGGKKVAVLGSMLELGKFSEQSHQNVAHHALGHVDLLYCLGVETLPMAEVWQKAGREVSWFNDKKSLIERLRRDLTPLDTVLIKGSRGKEMWTIIEELEK